MDLIGKTVFPSIESKDLCCYSKMAIEQWERMFPLVAYLKLLHPQEAQEALVSRNQQKTVVDDLWSEPVPRQLKDGWKQPHSDLDIPSTPTEKYLPEQYINAKIEFEPQEETLTKFGIDEPHTFLIHFLNPLLIKMNVSVNIGDAVVWSGKKFIINKVIPATRWMQTDYFLTRVCSIKSDRYGS